MRAILGLGIVGCGTNNSRLANILLNIASYYGRDTNTFANHMFCARIA